MVFRQGYDGPAVETGVGSTTDYAWRRRGASFPFEKGEYGALTGSRSSQVEIFFHRVPGSDKRVDDRKASKLECHLEIKELGFNSVTGCVQRFVKHEAERVMPMRKGMALMTMGTKADSHDLYSAIETDMPVGETWSRRKALKGLMCLVASI